ncbi:DUF4397 domain-containing protein [Amycolatopsis vancoresmycina]|uniref:LPXTG-motif cell wall anchor domain-containing protein n=1 Tax=Amycolatopsis vancoresmycina DSM 44592 TaxID=1292037 RepID=R1I000_9PSEU|nr:DUF4397 domain-containing protein [Amycolatopsis vancoresmycina]EOD69080.1 LPXTG-motif cell wall anchor domain-containing protein [Amycolatopsis vancoresmycina DSM 44592]
MRTFLLRPGGLAAAALLFAALTPVPAEAATAPGPGVGWIRVGHLSPKVPPVDIYFAPFGQAEKVVIRKAGYGAVTPYSSLGPGKYTLSMRPADAAATTPPALSATIEVAERSAYSLLVFTNGPGGTLKGDLVTDDLTPPAAGKGRVRVVEGSAAIAPVTVAGPQGVTLAKDAAYGQTSSYVDVPEGRWPLQLSAGSVRSSADVDVKAGSSTTLLVTENAGTLKANPISDGASLPEPPKLGVETGGGGTAPVPRWPAFAAAAGLLAALLLGRRAARAR